MGCGASNAAPKDPAAVASERYATSGMASASAGPPADQHLPAAHSTDNYEDDAFEEDDEVPSSPPGPIEAAGRMVDDAAPLHTQQLAAPTEEPPVLVGGEPPTDGDPPPAAQPHATQQADPSVEATAEDEPPRPARSAPWSLITLEQLELGELLGSGGNGTVHAAVWQEQRVAVKTLRSPTAAQLATIEGELLVHAPLLHSGIVRLLGACLVPPSCCIVLEHCDCSLFHRLHKEHTETTRHWLLHVATEVADGMAYLHAQSPPVIHRDLKSPNVLLQRRPPHSSAATAANAANATATAATANANATASGFEAVKICDFGLVGVREPTAGTPNYMAPELLEARPWSASVDVFAFGVLLNELFTREVSPCLQPAPSLHDLSLHMYMWTMPRPVCPFPPCVPLSHPYALSSPCVPLPDRCAPLPFPF